MAYVVADAPDCLAIDTSQPVDGTLAVRLSETPLLGLRIEGIAQYIGLHDGNGPGDINRARLEGILAAGLGLWLVQHCLRGLGAGWVATRTLGEALGASAARNAALVGYLAGAHVALDLEGCASVGQDVIDYVNAWCEPVKAAGYLPLLYVGFDAGIGPQALYECLPDVHLYWSDAGPRQVTTRGFAIKQHAQTSCCGIPVDPDSITADLLGGRLRWMIDDSKVETVPPQDRPTQPST